MKVLLTRVALCLLLVGALESCDQALNVPANREEQRTTTNVQKLSSALKNVDFGQVSKASTKAIQLRNLDSVTTIVINSISLTKASAEFSLEQLPTLPFNLKPGGTLDVHVHFNSSTAGNYDNTLLINGDVTKGIALKASYSANAPNTLSNSFVHLKASTTVFDFGVIALGSSKTSEVVLQNTSIDSSVVIDAKNLDTKGGVFQMVSGLSFPLVLQPNSAITVALSCTPLLAESYSTFLEFLNSNGEVLSIKLIGTAVVQNQVVSVQSYDLGAIKPAKSFSFDQILSNPQSHSIFINSVSYRYSRDLGLTWVDAPDQQFVFDAHLSKNALTTEVGAGANHTFECTYTAIPGTVLYGSYMFEATVNYTDASAGVTKDIIGIVTAHIP